MSRFSYSEEEDFPGQFFLWQANCARSLKGKPGQAALRELEAALLALPKKRLIANELDNGVDCCAIGALARYKGIKPDPDAYDDDSDGYDEGETEEVGVECGMPRLVAWKVVELNDIDLDYSARHARTYTPEERYDAVLKWTRKLLETADV